MIRLQKSTSNLVPRSVLYPFRLMKTHVFRQTNKQKILRSIVNLNSINVMNLFSSQKRSVQYLRHHISVLSNSSPTVSHRRVKSVNPSIPISSQSSAFPPMILFPFKLFKKATFATSFNFFVNCNGLFLAYRTNNQGHSLLAVVDFPVKCKGSWLIPDTIFLVKSKLQRLFDYHVCIVYGKATNVN